MNIFGQAGRKPLNVEFVGGAAFGLDENLVAFFVGKADDFVFDARAVAWPFRIDKAAVNGGEVEVFANDAVGFGGGTGQVAAHLLALNPGAGVKTKPARLSVTGLRLHQAKVYSAAIHPRRGARLEAIYFKTHSQQGIG